MINIQDNEKRKSKSKYFRIIPQSFTKYILNGEDD